MAEQLEANRREFSSLHKELWVAVVESEVSDVATALSVITPVVRA